jgi:predicted ribonuclease toxin of YeeF-YezG toxin-antitoxin module
LSQKFDKEQELSDEEIKKALKEIIDADEDLRGKKGIEEFFTEFMHLFYPECSDIKVEKVERIE